MKHKLSLQQRMLQKLSPQQIQVIKLLEIPTLQLEQRIKKELEENLVLELDSFNEEETNKNDDTQEVNSNDDEFSLDDYLTDEDEIPAYRLNANNYSKDDKYEHIPFSVGTTFHESLTQQLSLSSLTEEQRILADYIIGNIDDDGYLRRDLESIVDDMAFSLNIEVDEKELLEVLTVIQNFDPPGVGARSLQECLLLQLNKKEDDKLQLAQEIIQNHFQEFTKKHYKKIQSKLDISESQLRDALEQILKLNPKPGSSYSNPQKKFSQHIVPDFILENLNGELSLSLNQRNMPELKINDQYMSMLRELNKKKENKNQKEAFVFVKQKLDSAKWFIDAIRQRNHTLLSTMSEIIDFQKEYFQEGDETKIKPMILKDIAERTNLDISTISRVSNSKYIQTNFGIYPLKYFFSEGLLKDDGEEASTREIKRILQDRIDKEDKRKPLTDEKLAEYLREQSYQIARRTVAKYREQLNIPVARLRKEL